MHSTQIKRIDRTVSSSSDFMFGIHEAFQNRRIPGWDCYKSNPTTRVNVFLVETLGTEKYKLFCEDFAKKNVEKLTESLFQQRFADDTTDLENAVCDLKIQNFWDITDIAQFAVKYLN